MSTTYTIKARDTFFTIATQLNVSLAALEAVNPAVQPSELEIGQLINSLTQW
jgi:hypothetical protein